MFALHTDDGIGVYLGLCSRGGAMPIVVDVYVWFGTKGGAKVRTKLGKVGQGKYSLLIGI